MEETTPVLNRSDCKYYDPEEGPIQQCYKSDEHLLSSIYEFITPQPHEWVFTVLYALVFVFGITGNFLVCYAVWRNHQLRTTTNFFLVNLAVADFLVMMFCLPPSYAQTLFETWFLGLAMCKTIEYYQTVCVIVSILTLTAISIERWFAICHPLSFKETKTRVIMALISIWVTAQLAAIPRLFIMTENNDPMIPRNLTVLLTSCSPVAAMKTFAFHYELFVFATFYILPIIAMGYTYAKIALCLWSSMKAGQLTEGSQNAVASQVRARRRIAKMLIVVVVVFILCFLPVYTWNIIRMSIHDMDYYIGPTTISILTLTGHWLVYFNSAINPMIYNFMSGKFRKEFRTACSCWITTCARRGKSSYTNHELEPLSSKRFHLSGQRYRVGEYDSSDVSRVKTSVTEA
ncbi:orexin receptor type 2-like isoform X1 [Haliotis rufescens]|uniref:orexin receptor type 2-like isoform X1 n=1 Tax=Haliotis rufescens TaxID=6454 RepID=UPI001EAFB224|nr:orexin receptor type 2-like isoform X1 [Haliotis rufescens]